MPQPSGLEKSSPVPTATGKPARGLRSVTVTGPDLARADALATTGLAMGEAGIAWLAERTAEGYETAVVTDDGRAFTSPGLPASEA